MTRDIREHLSRAFAAASRFSARNQIYGMKAKRDGRTELSRLFAAVSESAAVNARRCLRLMRGRIGDTDANLKTILDAEIPDLLRLYADGLAAAGDADGKVAMEVFTHSREVSRQVEHLLRGMVEGDPGGSAPYHVCQVCGHVAVGGAPERCPVCNAIQSKFRHVGD